MTVFTKINTIQTGVYDSSIAIEDFDGDGDEDLLVIDYDNDSNSISTIYTNDGTGNFTLNTETNFDNAYPSLRTIEDFDGDGDLDLLVIDVLAVEYNEPGNSPIKIYTNDGTGSFSENTEANFAEINISYSTAKDFDGDGDLDLLITGSDNDENSTIRIYNNDGTGNFDKNSTIEVTDVFETVRTTIDRDFDGDGDLDLLINGSDNYFAPISVIYTNDGSGSFTLNTKDKLSEFFGDSIAEDFNGDGDLDLLITGYDDSYNLISGIYTNDGSGSFTQNTEAKLPDFVGDSIAEDFNGDGDLDLLITGYDDSYNLISEIYTNDGSGSFTQNTEAKLPNFAGNSIPGDFDADGDLDLMLAEYNKGKNSIIIYINDGTGSFSEHTDTSLSNFDGSYPIVEDFNGDDVLDLLIRRSNNIYNTSFEIYRNDTIKYLGNDILVGTVKSDRLNGGADDDVIYGRSGDDTLAGGNGNDKIYGQSGNDALDGGAGNDTLFGGNQFDSLNGGDGDDYLDGFNGITIYTGGSGSDRFIFNNDTHVDWVKDFEPGVDTIGLSDGITFAQLEITGNVNSFIAVNGDRIGVLLDVNPNNLDTSSFIKLQS